MELTRSSPRVKVDNFIVPMMAQLSDKAFDDKDWIFEVKWDGYRAIAELQGEAVKLYSRNGLSFISKYPPVIRELKRLKLNAVLDGEIVALNKNGLPDFQKLQHYESTSQLIYYVFDCLHYNGIDITDRPLMERKQILKDLLPESDVVRYAEHHVAEGISFFRSIKENNLEGMIAKKADSQYYAGKRTALWLKIKHHNTQEAVIAGFTAPRGGRRYFGALVLGMYKDDVLQYIGHTGTGFNETLLKEMYSKLQPLIRAQSPFKKKIKVNSPVTWVEPRLVCNIKFSEITEEGNLRHPVFMGLRVDKPAKDVETNEIDMTKKVMSKEKTITVNGHPVKLTNQDKLYWPDENIRKGDVINYYNKVYRYIIKYLKDRPQSLRRNPNGIEDDGFFQKDADDNAPKWVKTRKIPADDGKKKIDYIICNDKATLFYMNNLGCIEINPWNSRIGSLNSPDYLVMDIDPTQGTDFKNVVEVALAAKEVLDKAGASCYCKTSGGRGLHVYVPLGAVYTYDQIRSFAEIIALLINEKLPDTTTTERTISKRNGRIYLDYLQNKKGQTLASVYSLRPRPGAAVSTPLDWKEVKTSLDPLEFNIHTIPTRLEKVGDLFAPVLKKKIDLKKCIKKLEDKY